MTVFEWSQKKGVFVQSSILYYINFTYYMNYFILINLMINLIKWLTKERYRWFKRSINQMF